MFGIVSFRFRKESVLVEILAVESEVGLGTWPSLLAKGLLGGRGWAGEGEVATGAGARGEAGRGSTFFSGGTKGGKPFCAFGWVLCFAKPSVKSFLFKLCFGLIGASASGVDFESESLLKSNLMFSFGSPPTFGEEEEEEEEDAAVLLSLVGICSGGTFGGILRGGMLSFNESGFAGRGVAPGVSARGSGGFSGGGLLSWSAVANAAKLGIGGAVLSPLRRLLGEVVEEEPRAGEEDEGVEVELEVEVGEVVVGLSKRGSVGLPFEVAMARFRMLGLEEEERGGEGAGELVGGGGKVSLGEGGEGVMAGASAVGMFTIIATGGLVNARRLLKGEFVEGRKDVEPGTLG